MAQSKLTHGAGGRKCSRGNRVQTVSRRRIRAVVSATSGAPAAPPGGGGDSRGSGPLQRLKWLAPMTLGLCSWVHAAAQVEASVAQPASSAVAAYVSSNAYHLISQPASVALPDVALLVAATLSVSALVLTIARLMKPAWAALLTEIALLRQPRPSQRQTTQATSFTQEHRSQQQQRTNQTRATTAHESSIARTSPSQSGNATEWADRGLSSNLGNEEMQRMPQSAHQMQEMSYEKHTLTNAALAREGERSEDERESDTERKRNNLPLEVMLSIGGQLMDRTAEQTDWRTAGRSRRNTNRMRGREARDPMSPSELHQQHVQQRRRQQQPQQQQQQQERRESEQPRQLPEPRTQPLDSLEDDWDELLERRRQWQERVMNALRQVPPTEV